MLNEIILRFARESKIHFSTRAKFWSHNLQKEFLNLL